MPAVTPARFIFTAFALYAGSNQVWLHFGLAAEGCSVSQPTPSVAIKWLEEDCPTRRRAARLHGLTVARRHASGREGGGGGAVYRWPNANVGDHPRDRGEGGPAPDASQMVIDQAKRIGLSQLHRLPQLRDRVGRGAVASACVLLNQGLLSASGRTGCARRPRPTTASRSPAATWTSAGRVSSWAHGKAVMPCCALPTWPRTRRCCSPSIQRHQGHR